MKADIARQAAVDALLRIFFHGAYPNFAIDSALRRKNVSDRGRRFLTQLVYGTVRHKLLCDHVLAQSVNRPLDDLPRPILTVLRMAVFQALFCTQVTTPAMVHTSVELGRCWGHAGLARLVNAVLRRVPKSLSEVRLPDREAEPVPYMSLRYSMPAWLVEEWMGEYGATDAETMCVLFAEEAPVTLRTNTLKVSPDQLAASLNKAGWLAEKRTPIPEEITLVEGAAPTRSKAFLNGHFMQQDAASMIAPHLLEPRPGDRVLDMCAAPGGKTTHLAQLAEGRAFVAALDVHRGRLELVRENAARLETPGVAPVCGDGSTPPFAGGFDRVLVDAPCSGLGTLRRHPDLKWHLKPGAPVELALRQRDLLRSAVRLCENGGLVVYSVCTFTRVETSEVVRAIVDEGRVEPEDGEAWLEPWKTNQGEYRTAAAEGGLDTFFFSRLRKVC